MKKTILFLIIAALLLGAAGCGGRENEPEPSESAAPAADATPTPEASGNPDREPATGSDISVGENEGEIPDDITTDENTGYPLLVGNGGTVFADLNGDGKQEEICLRARAEGRDAWLFGSFEIDGHEYADEIYELGFNGYDPDEHYYAITDIDESDSFLEIALQDVGPSSDYTTSFFRYDGQTLRFLGTVEGLIYYKATDSGELSFDGKGTVDSVLRLGVLQTWWAPAQWKLSESGALELVRQEVYYSTTQNEITALEDVSVYAEADPSSAVTTLAAGQTLTVKGTDDAQWVLAQTADGKECWLNLVQGYAVLAGGEYKYCWDVFDGLCMVD